MVTTPFSTTTSRLCTQRAQSQKYSILRDGEWVPSEATMLSEAGQWMCIHGQTRGGILRLRRAIAILNKSD